MKLHCRSWDGRFFIYLYAGPLRLTLFRMRLWHRQRKIALVTTTALTAIGAAVILWLASHADDIFSWLESLLTLKGHHR